MIINDTSHYTDHYYKEQKEKCNSNKQRTSKSNSNKDKVILALKSRQKEIRYSRASVKP